MPLSRQKVPNRRCKHYLHPKCGKYGYLNVRMRMFKAVIRDVLLGDDWMEVAAWCVGHGTNVTNDTVAMRVGL
jgi:hypothetical protein